MSIDDCVLINFSQINDTRGSLSIVECHKHIHFDIQRVFYIHALSLGATRGGHAHYKLQEVIIPIVGSFNVKIHDGFNEKKINLFQPSQGLYLPPLIWVELSDFSTNAICLVLASNIYHEEDYIRDYQIFLKKTRNLVDASAVS